MTERLPFDLTDAYAQFTGLELTEEQLDAVYEKQKDRFIEKPKKDEKTGID